jgi:hypothetical protein
MDIRISPDAIVSGDRNLVVFDAHIRERSVQYSIAREALELYFWAPAGASDAQSLKAYVHGRNGIGAIVEPKASRDAGRCGWPEHVGLRPMN